MPLRTSRPSGSAAFPSRSGTTCVPAGSPRAASAPATASTASSSCRWAPASPVPSASTAASNPAPTEAPGRSATSWCVPAGRECGCGQHGCLEALASAGAVGRAWAAASGDPAADAADARRAVESNDDRGGGRLARGRRRPRRRPRHGPHPARPPDGDHRRRAGRSRRHPLRTAAGGGAGARHLPATPAHRPGGPRGRRRLPGRGTPRLGSTLRGGSEPMTPERRHGARCWPGARVVLPSGVEDGGRITVEGARDRARTRPRRPPRRCDLTRATRGPRLRGHPRPRRWRRVLLRGHRGGGPHGRRTHRRHGTTTMVASTVTGDLGNLARQAGALSELVEQGDLAGVHFEGPFISPCRCGAHDRTLLRDPDPAEVRKLVDAARGSARMMTLAPNCRAGWSRCGCSPTHGVIAAIGHTDSDVRRDRRGRRRGRDRRHPPLQRDAAAQPPRPRARRRAAGGRAGHRRADQRRHPSAPGRTGVGLRQRGRRTGSPSSPTRWTPPAWATAATTWGRWRSRCATAWPGWWRAARSPARP